MSARQSVALLVGAVLVAVALSSQAADESPDPAATTDDRFGQFNFGLGIGISDLSRADVLETQIEQGLVRVTDSEKTKRGLWLETHYLLDRYAFGKYASHGPFFGIQVLEGDDVIKSVALGYMISLKRSPIKDKTSKTAFNLGLGLHTTKIKVLGNGIVEDQALPTGVESVRLKSKDETGVMLMFSVSVF